MTTLFDKYYPNGIKLSENIINLFEYQRKKYKALTHDDVSLSEHPSSIHPSNVKTHSFITKNICLKTGIMSSAMDTVTEKHMALALAKMGGIGIIHRNLSVEEQAKMVYWVRKKIHSGGMIDNPITFLPSQYLSDVQYAIKKYGWNFTSFPIVNKDNQLVGLLTRDETDFVETDNPKLEDIMKPLDKVVYINNEINSSEAYNIMKNKRIKKLPITDKNNKLIGMYVWGDIKKDKNKQDYYSLDKSGNFLVGAAIGLTIDDYNRALKLVESGCQLLVLDTSHGACKSAVKQIERLRIKFGNKIDIIVGNIASYDSARYLLEQKYLPDGIKVGIGCGSICTTRIVTGHGMPQLTAIYEVWRAMKITNIWMPIIADGGIRSSGDIVKCYAVGACGIMLGSQLASCNESPGDIVIYNSVKYKPTRGMGSREAMKKAEGSRNRYMQNKNEYSTELLTKNQQKKIVPEGVKGYVKLTGPVESKIIELMGGIKSGLAHSGAKNIIEFQSKALMWKQTTSGIKESNPHSIVNIHH